MDIWRGRLAIKYIFFEMLPTFILGVLVFVSIILMFQTINITEYVIVHGQSLSSVGKVLGYSIISMMPVILPMSLLFAVLLTYGRMSADSEIVAMKALGLNLKHIALPALIMSLLIAGLSAQTSFFLAPWGNRQMELLVHEIGQIKPGVTIREGVFSEGFFDLVVYANEVDSQSGVLSDVFIYDERNGENPFTIIAHKGQIVQDQENHVKKAILRLFEGNIHRTGTDFYTKINFKSYDINLFDAVSFNTKTKTPMSYNFYDLRKALRKNNRDKNTVKLEVEYHKRWAISVACLIFGMLGVGLGTTTNRRSGKSSGFVICVILIVLYWIFYAGFESLAKSGPLPVPVAIWIPNFLFGGYCVYSLRQATQ